jgi:hypothetical protein
MCDMGGLGDAVGRLAGERHKRGLRRQVNNAPTPPGEDHRLGGMLRQEEGGSNI